MVKQTLNLSIVIFISALFSLTLLSYKETYDFMIWNLLLALIPLFFSNLILLLENKVKKILLIPLFILWLLFLPNSPYLITDFLHLSYLCKWDKLNYLYNVITLFSSVWVGLVSGLFSIYQIHILLNKYFGKYLSWVLVLAIFILSGFGIYIGRFSRLNSWDLINKTSESLNLMINYLMDLYMNKSLFEFFISITITSILCYLTFYSIVSIKHVDTKSQEN